MTTKNANQPSKKRLFLTGIAIIIILLIGMSYILINNKPTKTESEEITTFAVDPEITVETEKALQLLSTQINKGLDSINNKTDEK